MCELLGLSASNPTAAEGPLREFRSRGGVAADNPDGWGLAYRDQRGVHVFKEPIPAARSALFAQLCATVRSDLVVAHVRKARYPPINTMTNTHPFKQRFAVSPDGKSIVYEVLQDLKLIGGAQKSELWLMRR